MRLVCYLFSVFLTACGAIMATQAVYDPENATASFVALSVMFFASGVVGGARVVLKNE